MKKLITLFALLITSSVVCLFAQNTEYDSLMQKAKDYESQKKYVSAMGTYWDAMFATDDFEQVKTANNAYANLYETFSSGLPGFDEYDEFSIYDGWCNAIEEFILYWTDNNPWIVVFGELQKGDLDYETKTAKYTIQAELETSTKFNSMYGAIRKGYFLKRKSNWTWNSEVLKEWPDFNMSAKFTDDPPLIFDYGIGEDTKIKELAKKKQKLFFFQESDSHLDILNSGIGYFTGIHLSDTKQKYSTRVGNKGVSVVITESEFLSCLSLSFNVIDQDGTVLLESGDVPLSVYKESSDTYVLSNFKIVFDKIPADLMRTIDKKTYTIIPSGIKVKYGYLSEKVTKNISSLSELSMQIYSKESYAQEIDKLYEMQIPYNEKLKLIPELDQKVKDEEEKAKVEKESKKRKEEAEKRKEEAAQTAAQEKHLARYQAREEERYINDSEIRKVIFWDIPDTIGKSLFEGCSNLSTIVTGENDPRTNARIVATIGIGENAFKDCVSLKSVAIYANEIGASAFEGCKKLNAVYLDLHNGSDTTKIIGDYAFKNCSSLESVLLTEGLESIGKGAFEGCSKLASIKIPRDIKSIAPDAFKGCSNLKTIEVPSEVRNDKRFKDFVKEYKKILKYY